YVITVLYENFFKSDVEKYIDGDFEGYLRKDIVAAQIKAVQEGKTPYPEDFIWALTPETAQTDVEKEFVQMSSEEVAKEWIAYLYEGKKGTIFEENPVADWANHGIVDNSDCVTSGKEKVNSKKWELLKLQQEFVHTQLKRFKDTGNIEDKGELKMQDRSIYSEMFIHKSHKGISTLNIGKLITCDEKAINMSKVTINSLNIRNEFKILELNELGIIKE
ncbi:hypothetical protein KC980_02815, partial [candidate division WWE3 bacterium]|nr:hypothetical protein [candidate division WWE3 bacterium]